MSALGSTESNPSSTSAQSPSEPRVFEKIFFTGEVSLENMAHAEFRDCIFQGAVWTGTLERVRFIRCKFEAFEWEASQLMDVNWDQCEFKHVWWKNSELVRVTFTDGKASEIRFQECRVSFLTVTDMQWNDPVFQGGRLEQLMGVGLHIQGLRLVSLQVSDAAWANCTVHGFSIESAILRRFVCAQGEYSDVHVMNSTGDCVRWVACTLREAYFESVRFAQSAWSQSNWHGGRFVKSDLHCPSFDGSRMVGIAWVDSPCVRPLFDGAQLEDCDMRRQQMPGISLRDATLERVDLRELDAQGMDARGVQLGHCNVDAANLKGAQLLKQERQVWAGARLQDAQFDEDPELRDDHWWVRYEPGPRR